ncbi:hypothetical protein BH23ACT5_BH23ACT5_06470 [soil metagenome]
MRAIELLGTRDSAAFRAAIVPIRPEDVKVRPVPRRLQPIWPRGVGAMATPWGVYVRVDLLGGSPLALADLLRHELVHVRQWKTHGPMGFVRRYLADYVRGRRRRLGHGGAYRAIALEVEARHLAGDR